MNVFYRTRVLSSATFLHSLRTSNHNVINQTYFKACFTGHKTTIKKNVFPLRTTAFRSLVTVDRGAGRVENLKERFFQHDDHLELAVDNNVELKLPYVWLRDHCRCSKCYNHKTNQRNFDTFTIELDETPKNVEIDKQNIKIIWHDNHESVFEFNWLEKNAPGCGLHEVVKKVLWNGEKIQREMPADVPYDDFMRSDEALKSVLMNIHKYGFGIVEGCPPTEEKTVEVSTRISHVRSTFYGNSWSFTADEAFDDSAFTNEGIGAHNDNTYLLEPSGIQVFHCLHHDGNGGENLLVDGFNAAEILKITHPDYYKALVRIPIRGQYIGDGHEIIATINVLNENHLTHQLEAVRYNPFDRSVLSGISFEDTNLFYKALKALSAEINSAQNEFWIKLTPGRVLFVDNWRVLHGRASFDGERVMAGVYLPKDQLNSRLRTIAGLTVY